MKDPFDPYRKWLGISPEDYPPHHYRLLGIDPFESDPDVIANAADGRMAQVKSFQIGKYAELSQRILNEIAAARLCLLSPEKKKLYDRKLHPRLEEEKKGIPGAVPPAARRPKPKTTPTVQTDIPAIETSSVFSYVATHGRKTRSWKIPVALGASAVALVVLAIFVVSRGNGPEVTQQPTSPVTQPEAPGEEPPGKAGGSNLQESPPVVPEIDPPQPVDPPEDPQGVPRKVDLGRSLADLLDPPDPGQGGHNGTGLTEPGGPADGHNGGDPATPAKRLPVPDDDVRQEAAQRIREIFKKDFADATTPDKKLALATRLSKQAETTQDDPAVRYVLMELACEMGAGAGELTIMLDVTDRMRQLYDTDTLVFRASLLEKVAEAVRTGSATSATNQQVVDSAVRLADEAVAADGLDLAGRFVNLAISTARRMNDPTLLRRLTAREREIDRMKLRFKAVEKALQVLLENPDDAEANLAAGRWYCFNGTNWAKGLPMLAKGSDAELANLAKQDLAGPEDPKQRMKLAQQWWDLSKREKGPDQRGIQAQAGYWYALALPDLAGLDKAEVEKRLAAIAANTRPLGSGTRGAIARGNVALATNGTTVSGVRDGAANLLDGNSTLYDGARGLSADIHPCEWTITFDKTYSLREIRFLPFDLDKRFCRYEITASPDGKEYQPLVDRSEGQWSGWQRITFPPRPVKTIKFFGLYNSANSGFHVVEFEAYCIPPPAVPR